MGLPCEAGHGTMQPELRGGAVKIGLHVVDFAPTDGPSGVGAEFAALGRTADELCFSHLSVMDHLFQIGMVGPPELPMLEAYTALGFLAGQTSQIRLLTLVTGVVYRHPGMLVKQVSTLDALS